MVADGGKGLPPGVQRQVCHHFGYLQRDSHHGGKWGVRSRSVLGCRFGTGGVQLPVHGCDGESGSVLFAHPTNCCLVLFWESRASVSDVRDESNGAPYQWYARSASELCGADPSQLHHQPHHQLHHEARTHVAGQLSTKAGGAEVIPRQPSDRFGAGHVN